MAYMNQERKQALAPAIKAILKKYGIKGSLAVNNHSTLVLNIKEGEIDFIANFNDCQDAQVSGRERRYAKDCMQVNRYWFRDHFAGRALEFFEELFPAMNVGNHDNSDIQTDYFDVGWYVDVNVGKWNAPYKVSVGA